MTLEYVTLNGDLSDGSGSPVSGTILFWPTQWLTDTTTLVIPPSPVTVPLSGSGTFSVALLATDNSEPLPDTWLWNTRIAITGTPVRAFTFPLLHATGATQDFATIVPVAPSDVTSSYTAGGDLSGTYPDPTVAKIQGTVIGSPPGGTTHFLAGNGTWAVPPDSGVPLAVLGDTLYENATPAPAVLSGNTTSTRKYLTQTGTGSASAAPQWLTIQPADVPTLNQATTGNAGNVTGVVAIGNGGTGSGSQNFAGLLTMTPVKTSPGYSSAGGDYVRGDASTGSGGSFVVTLPSGPADLTTVGVKMVATSGTNTVTVNCQGSDHLNISAGATSYVLSLLWQGAVFQYNAAGSIWLVTGDNLSLAQLDARYIPTTSLTQYELLAGGASNTLQQLSGTGTSGQYLISNGAGVLPSWQTGSGGSGMVNPMTAVGDTIYEGTGPAPAKLAGNASATKQFMSMTSSVPSWGILASGDIPTLNQSTTGTAAGLSSTLAIGSGGTSAGSAPAALTALGAAPIAGAAFTGNSSVTGTFSATKAITAGFVALTDASTIVVDASLGNHFRVTLGGNRTLGTPSNPTNGQKISFEIIQPSSGGPYTLGYTSVYAFSTDIPSPTLTTTASERDFLGFIFNSTTTKWYLLCIVHGY